jgi:hypothetical protein
MIHRIIRASIALALILTLILPPPPAKACGPFFPVTIFIQSKHPDLPFQKFAAGQLGVFQPSYARSYLVVAYRYLSGVPFDASEQQQLLALWAHRLGREQDWLKNQADAYQVWLEARYKFASGSKPDPAKKDDNPFPGYKSSASRYSEFENCADDAFLTAAKTLEARSKQFGQHSEEVRNWLDAQDRVFDNCGGSTSATSELPEEAPKQFPAILRSDRSYQVAAAYFYDQNWSEAEQRFQAIAQDSSSPWQALAAIVSVRAKLRKITLSEDEDSPENSKKNLAAYATIDAELRNLEKIPSMHTLLPAIWRMRGFVDFRLDPDARRRELAAVIELATHRATLREDLDDYTQLLDRGIGDDGEENYAEENQKVKPQSPATKAYPKSASLRLRSPLTDWILTFQADNESATAHAISQWKQSRSLPWLVASLSKATSKTPGLAELLEAAAAIPPNSPAYLAISFHRARLLAQSGKEPAAIQLADNILAQDSLQQLDSSANLFKTLRMKFAHSLDEFLQFAPRRPSVVTYDADNFQLSEPSDWCSYGTEETKAACRDRNSPPPLFDTDAATILTEGLPMRLLSQAASSPRLPENLRRQVAQSAWVRAILFHDDATARQLAPVVSTLSPDLTPGLKTYLDADDSSRLFSAAFLILHRPELHPYVSAGVGRETSPGKMDSFHDNWWCSFSTPTNDENWGNYFSVYTRMNGLLLTIYSDNKLYYPDFLTDAEKKSAESEWTAATKLDTAPNWLASEVLAFAKSHPDDHRVPEALHYVVRATHLGCTDANSSHYSRSAFRLLHSRYPNNPWTTKTPYWY